MEACQQSTETKHERCMCTRERPVGGTATSFPNPAPSSVGNAPAASFVLIALTSDVIVSFSQGSKHRSGSAMQENPSSLNTDVRDARPICYLLELALFNSVQYQSFFLKSLPG